ncbi:MAG: cytochrome P450 [Acidimicrobiales bacterium]
MTNTDPTHRPGSDHAGAPIDTATVDYDPVGADTLADPFAAYAELRSRCPVHHHDGLDNPMLTFSRREDVQWVLTDQDTWSNRYGPGISFSDDNVGDLQRYDPPVHETRRRFLRAPFLPRTVDASRPGIAALANELVDSFEGRDVIELHDDYALPLPVRAFTALMGIDDDAADDFKAWADALTIGMTYPDQARDARRAMSAYTRGQIEQRRTAAADAPPGTDPVGTVVPDGLLSHLACHALDDGTVMPVEEVAAMVGQLLVAGHETTTSLITNAVWRLLEVPDRWERVVAEPDLVPNVIEESLRHDPPVLGLCKTNNVAVERHGVDIDADTKVMILYASANREEALFDRPDEFVMDRPLIEAKRHLSFGWGAHFCLGSHLARLTGRVALEVLVERMPHLSLAGEPERIGAPFLWGRSRLPISPNR